MSQIDKNFQKYIEVISRLDFEVLSKSQQNNIAVQMFLKSLSVRMKKNQKRFHYPLSSVNNLEQYFCSRLFHGKKRYRIFFELRNLRSEENSVHLDDDVGIYNKNWNFQESGSFLDFFEINTGLEDKFKFKVCCDVNSNNSYDALVIAKQKCLDALSGLSFTYFSPEIYLLGKF